MEVPSNVVVRSRAAAARAAENQGGGIVRQFRSLWRQNCRTIWGCVFPRWLGSCHGISSRARLGGINVEVSGGALAVEVISAGTEPVLAIHGISSQRRLWNWLRAAAPDLSLVAPDLRGRGDSVNVQGPSSIGRHVADMIAVLDSLGLDAVHVCGMSMGGFVAVELATAHPGRVKSLILVDGGFPMTAPPGLTPRPCPRSSSPVRPAGPRMAVGPRVRRLLRRADRAPAGPGQAGAQASAALIVAARS